MSQCLEMSTQLVCYNDGTVNKTLIAHFTYGTNATGDKILSKVRYTDEAGVVIDTSSGTVTAGACAVTPPDVEAVVTCDVQADGTVIEFIRQSITTFDSVGAPATTVKNWELDYSAEYVPTGTVGACNQDCDPVTPISGISTAW